MEAEDFLKLMREKDAHITQLREYAQALEAMLGEKRAGEASDRSYEETRKEIDALRYEHGLRTGTLSLR